MKAYPALTQFLVISNIVLTGFIAFIFLTGFDKKSKAGTIEEINAERINIIGENGKPVLVISNRRLMPGPTINGKAYSRDVVDGREYMSGMLFFNELGDEVGGIQYAGIRKDSSGYAAVGHLSFDQWQQNQVMALDYNDKNGNRYAGLRIWDRPVNASFDYMLDILNGLKEAGGNKRLKDSLLQVWNAAKERGENGVERLFIGSKNEVAQILLKDRKGNVRAKLYVADSGEARLEFLNQRGEITAVFPKH
ncbi:MAG TPA: hypothetical protein PLN49_13205 [Ferruginibacter sp.]|nr:hypothetical protein [Ferruginibacter sp.]HNA01823.1 hypothetical protein [Ferruginibacter sp.]HNF02702.1 hypothetical protein [Ferruginibacter sp.]HNH21407.1 hypothetical protein [Ferruginibacter sp.]HNJ29693.1 hypothetical protein [Ferruginibacter sp.]